MKKLLLALIIVVIDQITKFIFTNKKFLFINYITNTGAAFGILKDSNLFLIIASFIVIAIILSLYKKSQYKLGLALMLAGTIGNLIDRIAFGFVRDFIDLKIWPIFNIADLSNTVGVAIIIYYLIKKD